MDLVTMTSRKRRARARVAVRSSTASSDDSRARPGKARRGPVEHHQYEMQAESVHIVVTPGELDQHMRILAGCWTVEFLSQHRVRLGVRGRRRPPGDPVDEGGSLSRPVMPFTGQWADLTLEDLAEKCGGSAWAWTASGARRTLAFVPRTDFSPSEAAFDAAFAKEA
jgi:hypothetical protein